MSLSDEKIYHGFIHDDIYHQEVASLRENNPNACALPCYNHAIDDYHYCFGLCIKAKDHFDVATQVVAELLGEEVDELHECGKCI